MTDTPTTDAPLAIAADEAPLRTRPSVYPEPFKSRMDGRRKRILGDLFGLRNFGANLVTLQPGGESALMHRHARQDELVYVVSGRPTLVTDRGEVALAPGMVAGFPAGGVAHQLVNRTGEEAVYLEIGDRTPGDSVEYPADDIGGVQDETGRWVFFHKDGTPY